MNRRRRQGIAPTLFPFLAVLVCTLGTLILILALVAQNASDAAVRQAETGRPVAEPIAADRVRTERDAAQVESLIAEAKFRTGSLVAHRDQQTAEIGDKRDQLTHLEDHIRRIRARLDELSEEVEAATRGEATPVEAAALVLLREQIEAEEEALRQLSEDQDRLEPRIVIVPHRGPNGTERRPVYLECTAQGLTVWPEGSTISMVQLEAANASANPLDAALRIIRHHALQHYGDSIAPYPMLIVRPDGIETYAAARQAMLHWDDQFGYELLPADTKLAFPRPDVALKQRVDEAIREAAIRQHARHAIAARTSLDRKRGSLPTLSAAKLDRAARASGFPANDPASGAAGYDPRRLYESAGRVGGKSSGGDDPYDPAAVESYLAEMRGLGTTAEGSFQPGDERTTAASAESEPPGRVQPNQWLAPQDAAASRTSNGDAQLATQSATSDAPAGQASAATGTLPEGNRGATPTKASGETPPNREAAASSADAVPTASRSDQPADTVQRQGRDWALPKHLVGAHGNAVVRTIRVICYPDQFLLLPAVSGGGVEMFGLADGDVERATLELATAVRDRISDWGASLPGGRWQPMLQVEVMPQADARFHQLRTLMVGSGIEVRQVPTSTSR